MTTIEMEMEMDIDKMKVLVKKDRYAAFVYKDLTEKGIEEKNALEIIYSMILDDSNMAFEYQKL